MSLNKYISAKKLTQHLHGEWHGRYGVAACPICQPEGRRDQRALTISNGNDRLLAHCHKSRCDFRDVLAAAGVAPGYTPRDLASVARRKVYGQAEAERKLRQALALWEEAGPVNGTAGAAYLERRGITLDPAHFPDLRYHARLKLDGQTVGGLVALMRDTCTNAPCGVHRTFLDRDGRKLDRRMLGRAAGAVVKLSADGTVTQGLGVAEGVETALHVLQAGWSPVWPCLSAGNLRDFPVMAGIEALTVFADHDESGTGEQAARQCCARWIAAGREAMAIMPDTPGHDFADGVAV